MLSSMRRPHHHQSSHPSISYPIAVDGVEVVQPYRPVSPPKTPPRVRRPSVQLQLSNPIAWLSRASPEKPSGPQQAAKPVRISEPQFTNSLDLMMIPRNHALGTGATVVRNANEALISSVHEAGQYLEQDVPVDETPLVYEDYRELPPLPLSPSPKHGPLPLLSSRAFSSPGLKPSRAVPPTPLENDTQPTEPSSYFPSVPPLFHELHAPRMQPPLDPVVISPMVGPVIDMSKTIITVETTSASHRTTLKTLMSRSSHLSRWLERTLSLGTSRDGDEDSLSRLSRSSDSDASAFYSIYHKHLNQTGVIPMSSSPMHIFLDRPSGPYTHIFTYLRSPVSTPDLLPRAVRLTSSSLSRLEGLMELRDEAMYLGLDELVRLCTEELATRPHVKAALRTTSSRSASPARQPTHTRTRSNDSAASQRTLAQALTSAMDCLSEELDLVKLPSAPVQAKETAPVSDETRTRRVESMQSHKSLFDLYSHSPAASQFPADQMPPLPELPLGSYHVKGLHRRMLSRTETEPRGFNSVKTRPTAEWI